MSEQNERNEQNPANEVAAPDDPYEGEDLGPVEHQPGEGAPGRDAARRDGVR